MHHRSIQDYLTARWFYHLLESGKPRRPIEGLLFATRYAIEVVVPSMRPVAAWLALWDDRIRERVIAIAPEVLLEHGDPSRLPVTVRSRLLRRFADLNLGAQQYPCVTRPLCRFAALRFSIGYDRPRIARPAPRQRRRPAASVGDHLAGTNRRSRGLPRCPSLWIPRWILRRHARLRRPCGDGRWQWKARSAAWPMRS